MFGQVIVHAKNIFALFHEIFTHGNACIRGQVLQRRTVGSGCGDNDGICHGAVFFQDTDNARHSGRFLTDGNIYANYAAVFLIDDRIDRDRCLSGLSVTDNKLSLSSSNRYHGINCLNTGLQRHLYRLAVGDPRRFDLDKAGFCRTYFPLAVNRYTQRIDDTADHGIADGHTHNAAGTTDRIAFFDQIVFTEQYGADIVFFQV